MPSIISQTVFVSFVGLCDCKSQLAPPAVGLERKVDYKNMEGRVLITMASGVLFFSTMNSHACIPWHKFFSVGQQCTSFVHELWLYVNPTGLWQCWLDCKSVWRTEAILHTQSAGPPGGCQVSYCVFVNLVHECTFELWITDKDTMWIQEAENLMVLFGLMVLKLCKKIHWRFVYICLHCVMRSTLDLKRR